MSIVIDATYEDGVLKPVRPLPLVEHTQVRVTVDSQAGNEELTQQESDPAAPTFGDEIAALVASLPAGVVESWPRDGAAQHDHYLYGTPKRPE